MALIDTATLLGIADRAAKQYSLIKTAMESADVEGGGWYFDRVSSTDDPDVEIPTGLSYEIVDEDLDTDFAIRNGTRLSNIVGAMETHFNRRDASNNPLQSGGWDGYLSANDIRVSWWFNSLYRAVKSRSMLAINVFSETDDTFATVEVDAGAVDFTDGVNYGNGNSTNLANGSNFAATQLRAVVVTMGSVDLDLRLGVKDIDDLPTTIDVTIPADSPTGTVVEIGLSSNRYLDVISADFVPGGDEGTDGDQIQIKNLKEREISL